MIYICGKCKFLFERKNEPSKCPSCENQCVMAADKNEQQTYIDLHGGKKETDSDTTQTALESDLSQ